LLRKTEDIVDKEEGCQDLVRLCISRSRVVDDRAHPRPTGLTPPVALVATGAVVGATTAMTATVECGSRLLRRDGIAQGGDGVSPPSVANVFLNSLHKRLQVAKERSGWASQQSRALMHRLYRLCHTFLRYAMPRTGMAASQPRRAPPRADANCFPAAPPAIARHRLAPPTGRARPRRVRQKRQASPAA